MKLASDGLVDLRLLMPLAAAAASAAVRRRRPSQGTPFRCNLLVLAFDSFVALHRGVPLEVDRFGERALSFWTAHRRPADHQGGVW